MPDAPVAVEVTADDSVIDLSGICISRKVTYCGVPSIVRCDAKCEYAWGRNGPPHERGSIAPLNPGTYEGIDAKPLTNEQRLNRWCIRECERSEVIPLRIRREFLRGEG
jgi:hypothetical protein